MRQSRGGGWQQAYNAQAVVGAEGSQLVLVSYIADSHSDRNELERALELMPSELGAPQVLLADAGYVNAAVIERLQQDPDAPELYVAVTSADNDCRRYEFRPPKKPRKTPITDPTLVAMREKVCCEEGRKIYGRRKCSVEPVFGIIKNVLGLRQFLRRGIEAVSSEWTLTCTAYNMKRLWALTGGG